MSVVAQLHREDSLVSSGARVCGCIEGNGRQILEPIELILGNMLAEQELWGMVIYVTSDQMAIFKPLLGADLRIDVGTERQDSLSQVEASAIRALERKTATPFRRFVTFWKQLPPDFFKQCMTDVYMPHIQSVERQTNRRQVAPFVPLTLILSEATCHTP